MVRDIPLVPLGLLSWMCPLPASCVPSALLTGRVAQEAEIMYLTYCKHYSTTTKTSACNQHYSHCKSIFLWRKIISTILNQENIHHSIPFTSYSDTTLSNTSLMITTTLPVLWYMHTDLIPLSIQNIPLKCPLSSFSPWLWALSVMMVFRTGEMVYHVGLLHVGECYFHHCCTCSFPSRLILL